MIWFPKKNCWEDMVPEKELLCGDSSQKRTLYRVQFLEKNRFQELRAVVGLFMTSVSDLLFRKGLKELSFKKLLSPFQ